MIQESILISGKNRGFKIKPPICSLLLVLFIKRNNTHSAGEEKSFSLPNKKTPVYKGRI